jgi:hypothetical protein
MPISCISAINSLIAFYDVHGRKLDDEKLDSPAVVGLRRAITEVRQRWLVIGWVTKNLL